MTNSHGAKKPVNVLLLALSGIGNVLMQSPTFTAIKKAHPDWQLTVWVAPRGTKALAANDPNIDEVIEAPYKNTIIGHLAFVRQLRANQFDIGIMLSPGQLVKGAAYMYLSSIPKRISHAYPFGNNAHSSFLLTDAVAEDNNLHDIEQNLRLLQPLGIAAEPVTHYSLAIPEYHQKKAADLLRSYSLLPTAYKLIGIHAGSAPNFLWKRWPLQNFAQVAKALIEKHSAHILLFGGSGEKTQNETLRKMIGDPQVSLIQTDLLTTAAVMQHCRLVISNDSGLMHLSAAAGVKTFGLFGPTSEIHTGPRGPSSHIIRALGTAPVYNTETNHTLGNQPHASMLAITPGTVFQAIAPSLD